MKDPTNRKAKLWLQKSQKKPKNWVHGIKSKNFASKGIENTKLGFPRHRKAKNWLPRQNLSSKMHKKQNLAQNKSAKLNLAPRLRKTTNLARKGLAKIWIQKAQKKWLQKLNTENFLEKGKILLPRHRKTKIWLPRQNLAPKGTRSTNICSKP